MAYMQAIGNCIMCNRVFSFNPDLVPSVRVDRAGNPDANGTRELICEQCVRMANKVRREQGLSLIEIIPGAYEPEECA